MIESLALRRRLDAMGPNARPQRTVTPVQRSNGVSPTPNPRGVEGRDLLLCRDRGKLGPRWAHTTLVHAAAPLYTLQHGLRAGALNLEPPTGRQEISGHWEINPYKFVSPIYAWLTV